MNNYFKMLKEWIYSHGKPRNMPSGQKILKGAASCISALRVAEILSEKKLEEKWHGGECDLCGFDDGKGGITFENEHIYPPDFTFQWCDECRKKIHEKERWEVIKTAITKYREQQKEKKSEN